MEARADGKGSDEAAAPARLDPSLLRQPALGPSLLPRLPRAVARPAYDRAALAIGMAHIGVGAFHRCHQAEYTDDLLARRLDRWGLVGINIRPPRLAGTLGRQGGLYTRLCRRDDAVEARVIGSILSVVDSQDDPRPALDVLSSAAIEVVTLTVTEKGYCHRPASGELDLDRPEIVHDLASPDRPQSLPALLLAAFERRRLGHGRPITVMSCDNIPANGAVLRGVVQRLVERGDGALADWIAAHVTFPSTMVDRIVPATTPADVEAVRSAYGYADEAVVVGEPYRQWIIEDDFAGRRPAWHEVGATFVADVTAHEHLKMRVLNAAQSSLAYLGLLAGYVHSFEAVADPRLAGFVRRMLVEETLPTLTPVPGMPFEAYVDESLARIANRAIHHRNHQIATDGSQKIVQRLLAPMLERLRRGEASQLLAVPVAAWMTYLIQASERFGRRWTVEDPYAPRIAAIADAVGDDAPSLAAAILSIDTIFDPALAADETVRRAVAARLAELLSNDPLAFVRSASGGLS